VPSLVFNGGIGVIVSGSEDVLDNNLPTARMSDSTVCVICGCSGQIISGSSDVIVNDLPTSRVTDSTVGTCNVGEECCGHSRSGTVIDGSPDIDIK